MRSTRKTTPLIAALSVWPGCGGPSDECPREPIWGTVDFEGKPLEGGMIQFLPATGAEAIPAGGPYDMRRFSWWSLSTDFTGWLAPNSTLVDTRQLATFWSDPNELNPPCGTAGSIPTVWQGARSRHSSGVNVGNGRRRREVHQEVGRPGHAAGRELESGERGREWRRLFTGGPHRGRASLPGLPNPA